jgi:hypothetical protein
MKLGSLVVNNTTRRVEAHYLAIAEDDVSSAYIRPHGVTRRTRRTSEYF